MRQKAINPACWKLARKHHHERNKQANSEVCSGQVISDGQIDSFAVGLCLVGSEQQIAQSGMQADGVVEIDEALVDVADVSSWLAYRRRHTRSILRFRKNLSIKGLS